MKKLINYFYLILFFTGIWIVLSESARLFDILSGLFFSIIAIFFSNQYLLKSDYLDSYRIKSSVLFNYGWYLFLQIYSSGLSAILKIIKGDDAVKIIDYKTCISDDLGISLLANAITLTPGTVTIDKEGRHLKILSFQDESSFSASREGQTCSKYELILRRLEQ